MEIFNGIHKFTVGNPEKLAPFALLDVKPCAEELGKFSPRKCRFSETDFSSAICHKGTIVKIPLGDENIYGFGLQLKSFNHKGRKVHIRCNADPLAPSGDSHAPIPFYVSSAGYGVIMDTARYASFYCGSSKKTDGGSEMLIEIPVAQGVDIYIIEGENIKEVVCKYVLFSGGGCKMPDWALGVWYRMHSRAEAGEIIETVENKLLSEDIPCDVLGLEPGWQTHAYSCTYKIDPQRMDKWDSMVSYLNDKNIKLNLWEHAYVHPEAEFHSEIAPYSGDYLVWNGLVPDFAVLGAREIFSKYHREKLVERGVSGFKLDECDGSDYTGGWGFPNSSVFPSGLDGEQMHNLLGVLYQKTMLGAFDNQTFGLARASHLFAAPLPFALYSDLYDQNDFLRGIVNSGFGGLLWTPELCHAAGVEDMVRRLQMLVFSAMTHINCWYIKNPPWFNVNRKENNDNIQMPESGKLLELTRYWLKLRGKLFPYLRAAFDKYFSEGLPPFRALVLDYENDPEAVNIADQYMMGDCLLVAPLIAGTDSRKVYLPKGRWKNLFTDETLTPGWHEVTCTLKQMPVYADMSDSSMLALLPVDLR